MEPHINDLWDCAAALTILKEAGAACGPFLGGGSAEHGNVVLASLRTLLGPSRH